MTRVPNEARIYNVEGREDTQKSATSVLIRWECIELALTYIDMFEPWQV